MLSAALQYIPVNKYPMQLPYRASGLVAGDDFSRESLNVTNAIALYTVAVVGAGSTGAISGSVNRLSLVPDANTGDLVSVRTSGLRIVRANIFATGMNDLTGFNTSKVQIDMPFQISSGTGVEGFIGVHSGSASLTAPPSTARHMGIEWDQSASNNFLLTSADGTTQDQDDTGIALDANAHILRIIWTAENTATIQMLTGAGVVQATQNVAALNGTSDAPYELHWYTENEGNAAKALFAYPWRVTWT